MAHVPSWFLGATFACALTLAASGAPHAATPPTPVPGTTVLGAPAPTIHGVPSGLLGERMPVTATASLRANVPATAVSSADADLETVSVTIRGFAFPAELRIRPGTRVVWLNADADDHDVAALDESWASPVLVVGASYSRDFLEEGRFRYLCKLHPFMQGVIVVE